MKISELIREYIDLKIEGAPECGEWTSIATRRARSEQYEKNLTDLETQIDAAVATKGTS